MISDAGFTSSGSISQVNVKSISYSERGNRCFFLRLNSHLVWTGQEGLYHPPGAPIRGPAPPARGKKMVFQNFTRRSFTNHKKRPYSLKYDIYPYGLVVLMIIVITEATLVQRQCPDHRAVSSSAKKSWQKRTGWCCIYENC